MIVDQNGNYQIVQPMMALPTEAKLSEDGKKLYRYNLNYLRIAGLVQESKDGKTQIGFPLVIKRVEYVEFIKQTSFYRLTTIKRDRVKQEENLADLIQPGDMYAFGVSAEYEKFDPIGSRKQFAAGFVIPGPLPTSKNIFKDRRNKNIGNNPGAFPDLGNIDKLISDQLADVEKQLSNIDISKAPANISSTLASNGIQVKTVGKKIVYEKDGKPFETTAKSPEELAKTLTPKSVKSTSVKGFQGYKGGFENTGKGTPQGDGKDKAMRQIANSAIVELASNNESSSKTSLGELGLPKEGDKVIMLARNGSLSGKALRAETKEQIRQANLDNAEFVVGDMTGVDSQFIDYLQEIGAKFTIYHTGATSRIQVSQPATSVETTEEFGDIDAMLASAPAAAFNVSIGAVLKAQAEYPVLNEFYMNELTEDQKDKIKQDLNITSFVNFVNQYKDYVNTSGGNQNSFVEQIKKCYL
jgi:hypothetical protein